MFRCHESSSFVMSLNQSRPSGFRWRRRGGNKNVPFIFDFSVRRRYRMSGREKTEKTYRRQCLSWKLFMGKVVAQFKDLLACCCAHERRAAQEVCLCFSFEKIMQKLMKCITSFSSLLESFGWPGGGRRKSSRQSPSCMSNAHVRHTALNSRFRHCREH